MQMSVKHLIGAVNKPDYLYTSGFVFLFCCYLLSCNKGRDTLRKQHERDTIHLSNNLK